MQLMMSSLIHIYDETETIVEYKFLVFFRWHILFNQFNINFSALVINRKTI